MGRRKRKRKPFVVRPWSFGKCPSAEEVRSAWEHRHRSQKDFIWLLSILGELSCFEEFTLEHLGGFGNIAGRQGGIKAYLSKNLPDLMVKYKSISRYIRLSYRLKQAFNLYPPMVLSLLHPDLPLPERNIAFLTNHARKVYRDFLANLPPQVQAFDRVITARLKECPPKFKWARPLPQSEWERAEDSWRRIVIRPKALAQIRADFSYYSRSFMPEGRLYGDGLSIFDFKKNECDKGY